MRSQVQITAFALDDQDAHFCARMGDMLASRLGEKNIADLQRHHLLGASLAVIHE